MTVRHPRKVSFAAIVKDTAYGEILSNTAIPVENDTMLAWGEVHYAFPLSAEQLRNYELKPAPDNPPVHKQQPTKNKTARDCR